MLSLTRMIRGIESVYDQRCRNRSRRRRGKIGIRMRSIGFLVVVLILAGVGVALLLQRSTECSSSRAETRDKGGGEGQETGAIFSTGSFMAGGSTSFKRLRDRKLAGTASCEENSFAHGGTGQALVLIAGILFTFNGLAIVCDEFFQASLEKISEVRDFWLPAAREPASVVNRSAAQDHWSSDHHDREATALAWPPSQQLVASPHEAP